VSHGRVRVDDRSHEPPVSEQLAAGDWVRVDSRQVERGSAPVEQIAAWRSGQLIARDRSVADVVDELRRSYSGAIVLADASLGRKRVTGVYNLADPAAALEAVARAHNATVHRLSPWLLVVN
jgi:transmembrane sensor